MLVILLKNRVTELLLSLFTTQTIYFLSYRGIGDLSAEYITKNKKWWFSAQLTPVTSSAIINTELTATFKILENSNHYAYANFYSGVAEGLRDYQRYDTYIRIGICLKPQFSNIFI